ncbi:MAG TPA: AraC family transcriptional regulator [Thermoleophilaceae bacterium]
MAVIGRSLGDPGRPAVYAYEPTPDLPSINVTRLDASSMAGLEPGHSHAHDFLVLAYFERGGGSLRVGVREWLVDEGDVYVVAPGEVVGVGADVAGLAEARGWAVSFPPQGLGPSAPSALLEWRSHPLLLPFARGAAAGAHRLRVPEADRPSWSMHLSALDRELRERHDGCGEAAVAHLTLLLVWAGRLAADVVDDLKVRDEPLLAEVFSLIEKRYADGISLKDVAAAVALTPGHLTTVVRHKTGRTVQDWILERRLAEARRLLVETDVTVGEVGRRAGFADPVYFSRCFRRAHGTTPLRWRRAGRGQPGPARSVERT